MKLNILSFCTIVLALVSCDSLDLNPLSQGSSETWNSNAEEIEMSLNGIYKDAFWMTDDDAWTDDRNYRAALTDITNATLTGQVGFIRSWWLNTYKAISRVNLVISSVDRASGALTQTQIDRYRAEARYLRASQYSRLLSHFGNIVYTDEPLDIEDALALKQSDPKVVLQKIYEDFDFAAAHLPVSYSSSQVKRATAGAALAMKARIALHMGDWATASKAAKACMDLGTYKLHSDFGDLFLTKTKNSTETIVSLPRSIALNVTLGGRQDYVPRLAGGWGAIYPSWELFCAFLCTDGLPIDESPLFNPREPFKNRDPRCTATVVEFGKPHLGFIYQPHPDSLRVRNLTTNALVLNNDTRTNAQFASFNGLLWKKGVAEDWRQNNWQIEQEKIIIRYADVLLMYAEAKIELNEIDQSVLDAINAVRARAYKVNPSNTAAYPAVTSKSQSELRKTVRIERRMEFALEGIRYMDIIRWRLAEKVLNLPVYGMLDPNDLRAKVVKPGLWFFPQVPPVDEDGVADFGPMYQAGLIKQITVQKFDASRQYLWPIPTPEVLTSGLIQNPGY
jgi:hypothetical protein